MAKFLDQVFTNLADKSADQTMAVNAKASAAASATAYLTATLEATTPEVRRLFSEFTTQTTMEQEALAGLVVTKGWANPYDTPSGQLNSIIKQSTDVISHNVQ
jgi:spore coat protein F